MAEEVAVPDFAYRFTDSNVTTLTASDSFSDTFPPFITWEGRVDTFKNTLTTPAAFISLIADKAGTILGFPVGLQGSLFDCCLTSKDAMFLCAELENCLSIPIPATMVYDYPNIESFGLALYNLATHHDVQLLPMAIASPSLDHVPLAIIAVSCRFPGGCDNVDQFWTLLISGKDTVTVTPTERLDVSLEKPSHGAFITSYYSFDPVFFGIPTREAELMDPQQRLLLELTSEVLFSAGLDTFAEKCETGVFVGICSNDFACINARQRSSSVYSSTGTAPSIASGRLSYTFGLTGPCISVDTACSSSLTAVHLASRALRAGDCKFAIAGGVNVILTTDFTRMYGALNMLSVDGRCKTFDISANGYVRGEGAGCIIMCRNAMAKENALSILANVCGSAINQDGRSATITGKI